MDQNLITAMAGVLGSVSGAPAAIATTWISQKNQTIRERAKSETRKRETLYGEFITEAAHLLADADISRNRLAECKTRSVAGKNLAGRAKCRSLPSLALPLFLWGSTWRRSRILNLHHLERPEQRGQIDHFVRG